MPSGGNHVVFLELLRGSQAPRRDVCGTHGSLRTMPGGGSAPSCCAFTGGRRHSAPAGWKRAGASALAARVWPSLASFPRGSVPPEPSPRVQHSPFCLAAIPFLRAGPEPTLTWGVTWGILFPGRFCICRRGLALTRGQDSVLGAPQAGTWATFCRSAPRPTPPHPDSGSRAWGPPSRAGGVWGRLAFVLSVSLCALELG